MIEIAAQMVAQDNAELATVFLQKTAIERALPEIDKRLATVRLLWAFMCLTEVYDMGFVNFMISGL